MRRNDAIEKLKQVEPALRELGVSSLYVFGSHSRDEATADSDLDVFVDPDTTRPFGFRSFMDAFETIERAVGIKVDYGTRSGLHPLLKTDIEREAVRVF